MLDEADARAEELDAWQATRSNTGGNPTTGVYRLVRRIRQLGQAALMNLTSGRT